NAEMLSSLPLRDLIDRGVALRPHEAVAIAQMLIHQPEASVYAAHAPFGPPTPDTVLLMNTGAVVCMCSATTPAVSEIAIFLHELLPPEKTRIPGGLRYAIGRALLEVEAPPFDSIEDFSRALARYEQGDREEVIRGIIERAELGPAAPAPFAWRTTPARAAQPAPIVPARPASPARVERRKAGSGVDELRRQLREADRQYYEAFIAPHEQTPPPFQWR